MLPLNEDVAWQKELGFNLESIEVQSLVLNMHWASLSSTCFWRNLWRKVESRWPVWICNRTTLLLIYSVYILDDVKMNIDVFEP